MSTRVLAPLAAVVLGLAAAGGSLTPQGQATTPGPNGLIVYNKELGGGNALFTIHPDGTGERRIVYVKGSDAEYPDWSPEGREIVFQLDPADNRGCRVAVVNADGSGLRNLSDAIHGCDGQPAFTANGRRIVFGRYDDKIEAECLWSMNLRGRDRRPITPCRGFGPTDPNVSPNGKWMTFVHIKEEDSLLALYAVRPDGTGQRRLVPYRWSIATKHDWSPDGKLILLTRNAHETPGKSANLVTIRPDGSGARRLTHYAGGSTNAVAGSFSPDGKQIVFRFEKDGKYALAVIDRDGGNLRLLTELGPDRPRNIDWGTHLGTIRSASAAAEMDTFSDRFHGRMVERGSTALPATSESPPSSAAPFVGTWRRLTTCAELVTALRKTGMQRWVTEFVAGNGFIPGVTSADQISDASNPCTGAVPRRHSHFFTRSGEFGSLDWRGQPVDDGRYQAVDRRTFVISKEFPRVTFHYSISGRNIKFAPVVPKGCPTFRCAWAIAMAYPGKAWQRVR